MYHTAWQVCTPCPPAGWSSSRKGATFRSPLRLSFRHHLLNQQVLGFSILYPRKMINLSPQHWSTFKAFYLKQLLLGTSLVAQWLRIHLPMQGTQVWALVREDPPCCGATKPVRHNYWACVLQLLKPTCLEPVLCNKRSYRNEKPAHRNEEQLPLAATKENPCATTKTQHSQK